MAKNKVQFQKSMNIHAFIKRYGSEDLCRDCKKICVTGILTNLLKGQQNAIIRRTHRPTAGGLLQP